MKVERMNPNKSTKKTDSGLIVPKSSGDVVNEIKEQAFLDKFRNRVKSGEYKATKPGQEDTSKMVDDAVSKEMPRLNRGQRRKLEKIQGKRVSQAVQRVKKDMEETHLTQEHVDKLDGISRLFKSKFGRYPTRSEVIRSLIDLYYEAAKAEIEEIDKNNEHAE